MSEIVERVAMALAKMDNFEWDGMKRTTSGALARDMYRSRARAAIKAMREPTEAMRRVGIMHVASNVDARVISHGDRHLPSVNVDNCIPVAWPAMIDEALK